MSGISRPLSPSFVSLALSASVPNARTPPIALASQLTPHSGNSFWSYELSKRLITNPETDTQRQAALKVLLCGGLAGIVTWASIFPLDVIKTRVQTQRQPFVTTATRSPSPAPPPSPTGSGERASLLRGSASSSPSRAQPPAEKGRRMGAWEITKHAYRTEGLPVFFRGLGICSVRAFIVNAVQWAVYEWMMQLMKDSKP